MDTGLVTIIVTALTLAGTYFTVKYKNGLPKKKDRLEVFLERYDIDVANLSKRLDKTNKKLDEAMQLIEEKDKLINELSDKLDKETQKYTALLKRFNTLKDKFEKEVIRQDKKDK